MAAVDVGELDAFPDGRGTPVEVGGRRLAVFRLGERVYTVDDRCSHRGFPLNDGTLDAISVRCRTHGACFDLATGSVLRGPARRAIRAYPTTVVEGRVLVDL
jgi:nitrite reductase/ring-hydroxylating ferredoxin subunit